MTNITILPIPTAGGAAYSAISNGKQSQGTTAGEALDALTTQLPEEERGTLVIVQNLLPDRFFTAEQQRELADLMGRWRTCRDEGKPFPEDEDVRLEAMIDAELQGAAARAKAMLDGLKR